MSPARWIAYRAGRLLKTVLFTTWRPVPFFGFLLVFVWVWWIALAVSKYQ